MDDRRLAWPRELKRPEGLGNLLSSTLLSEPGTLRAPEIQGTSQKRETQGTRLEDVCTLKNVCKFNMLFVLPVSEKAMAPHSSTLGWKIPWTEEPGRLQSMGSLGVGHD